MTCKDCINYHWCQNNNGCTDFYDTNDDSYTNCSVEAECDGFKDKSEWLHLPYIAYDTRQNKYHIVSINKQKQIFVAKNASKEEAEKALAERNKQ